MNELLKRIGGGGVRFAKQHRRHTLPSRISAENHCADSGQASSRPASGGRWGGQDDRSDTHVCASADPDEMFDRFAIVPERYDIPNGQELVNVVVTPEVRSVLSEIKRMPGRRVSGSRAEAFVRNPFALLGAEAATVIDADDFEKAREAAHLGFQRFSPAVRRNDQQKIAQVLLVIEDSASDGVAMNMSSSRRISWVYSSRNLPSDWQEIRNAVSGKVMNWRFSGDTPGHLTQLRQALEEWVAPSRFSMAEVFDLSRYWDRVRGLAQKSSTTRHLSLARLMTKGGSPTMSCSGLNFCPSPVANRLLFRWTPRGWMSLPRWLRIHVQQGVARSGCQVAGTYSLGGGGASNRYVLGSDE